MGLRVNGAPKALAQPLPLTRKPICRTMAKAENIIWINVQKQSVLHSQQEIDAIFINVHSLQAAPFHGTIVA